MLPANGIPFKKGVYKNKMGMLKNTIKKAALLIKNDMKQEVRNNMKTKVLKLFLSFGWTTNGRLGLLILSTLISYISLIKLDAIINEIMIIKLRKKSK